MFRPQKMLKSQPYFEPCLPTVEQVGDEFICIIKSQNGEFLPPCENFDLKKMLDAGVDLKQVNSKILTSRIVNVSGIINENRIDEPIDEPIDESRNPTSKQGE